MGTASITYELKLDYLDSFTPYTGEQQMRGAFRSSVTVHRRQNSITRNNSQTKNSWSADIQDAAVGGFDFEKALEKLGDADKKQEEARLKTLFESFNTWDGEDLSTLTDAVSDYVARSALFEEAAPLVAFFEKFKTTQHAFEAFSTSGAETEKEQARALAAVKAELKRIWGPKLKFTDTSAKELANDFDGFTKMLADLNAETPPLSFDTPMTYSIDVKEHKRPWNAKRLRDAFSRNRDLSGTVAYKDLPARLFAIQERLLGALPDDMAKYRICVDRLGSKDTACRVAFEADTVAELVAGAREKIAEHEGMTATAQDDGPTAFQVTIHSYRDRNGFFCQCRPEQDLETLLQTTGREVKLPGQAVKAAQIKPKHGG